MISFLLPGFPSRERFNLEGRGEEFPEVEKARKMVVWRCTTSGSRRSI